MSDLVPDLLDEYGTHVRLAMADYLKPREPRRYLYNLVADYPRRGGRMLRPSLCLAAARAFGADIDAAVLTAVAIEVLHNAFLVHDDVEDESDFRRGQPTLNATYGSATAVNVGDAMIFVGLRALLDNTDRLGLSMTMQLLDDAEQMVRETVEGQSIELGWRRDNALHLGDDDYLHMVLKKTCWYTTIFPLRAGALIGSNGAVNLDLFVRFGFFAGAAFQIQDDLLNLTDQRTAYGKELNGDIQEGKRTLMLIHLLKHTSIDERQHLAMFLSHHRQARTGDQIAWIRERMDAYGSLEYARQIAHGLAGAARHAFDELFRDVPDSRDRRFLREIVPWMLSRA